MSKYTMAQVETLTGVKAHTLRKWETRYSFLEPERTKTNIRFYSDSQLKKLLNISVLIRNGYRVSKIDKMTDHEISSLVSNILLTENDKRDEIAALVVSMVEFDETKFDTLLKTQIIKHGLLSTTTDIIYPFLSQVGVLWGINRVMPAQEHFVSNLIKKRFYSHIDSLPQASDNANSILMFLPENEYHEIGLLLAYYIAREIGWKVFYLGQNVPIHNIKQVVRDVSPDAMLTMFVTPVSGDAYNVINDVVIEANIPLFVSGSLSNFSENTKQSNIIHLLHPKDFLDKLNEMS